MNKQGCTQMSRLAFAVYISINRVVFLWSVGCVKIAAYVELERSINNRLN